MTNETKHTPGPCERCGHRCPLDKLCEKCDGDPMEPGDEFCVECDRDNCDDCDEADRDWATGRIKARVII